MKTFFRLLLIIFVWALISAVVLGVNLLVLERPMEDGVRIIVILFLAWLAFLLLRKLYIRYRAKQRVKGLINEEAAEGGGNRGLLARVFGTGYGPGDFRSRFKDIVKVLKNSKLRTKGDPVYVMPWYLVLGGRDTGKSCLVKEARLPGPSLNEPALDSGGESFDWTLHNTGVLVDVPGRFVIDPGQYERQSWKGLFESLLQYRRKEPINGVVVTVSIDRLRGADELALAEEGRKVRERLDEIMGALSINIPVYLVVTKCDQLAGYSDWVKIMPEERLDDAMGVAGNADVATGRMQAATFISSAVEQVAERLKDLMLAVMNKASDSNRMLLLPAELESISSALMQFAGSAFQTNPYQESPMLRGLYFVGRFEHDTEVEEEKLQTLFSRDLFSRLLPADRSMVSTLSSAERAQIFTRRVVMSFWTIFMVILFLGLSAVFYGNYSYLGRTAKNYAGQLEPIGDFSTRVATLADLREVVLDVDQTVSSWWMPWFEVGETPVFVQKLERLYVSRFQNKVLDPVEDALAQRLRGPDGTSKTSTAGGDSRELALLVNTLVRKIRVLEAYIGGASEEDLANLPPAFGDLASLMPQPISAEAENFFNTLYVQSLLWDGNQDRVGLELARTKDQLLTVLRTRMTGLEWLIDWANKETPANAVLLSSYWTGTGQLGEDVIIPAAFTQNGKADIDAFIADLMETAQAEAAEGTEGDDLSAALIKMRERFDVTYRRQFISAWEKFAMEFPRGRQVLRGRGEWVDMIDATASRRNPFFRLLDDMNEQLAAYKDDADAPDWLQLVAYYGEMKAYAPDDGIDNSKGAEKKTALILKMLGLKGAAKAVKKVGKSRKKLGVGGGKAEQRDAVVEQAAESLGEYRKALLEVAFNAESNAVSYKGMLNLFNNPQAPSQGDGPDARAFAAVKTLKTLIGKETRQNKAFWTVYTGSLDVMLDYMRNETGCYIQNKWNSDLLVEIEGVPEYKLGELMFGAEGKVWGFVNTTLGPMVKREFGKGYVKRVAKGRSVPLRSEFLTFLSRGRDGFQVQQANYPVNFNAFPTSVRPITAPQVSLTSLALQCANDSQVLDNFNFAISKTFDWTNRCGDVTLSMDINGQRLEKTWKGPKAFPEFLTEFKDGTKRFVPEDFPSFSADLKRWGVEGIDVEFEISGQEPVVGALNAVPATAPTVISSCWAR